MNELTLNIKSNSKTPLYEQIYQYIKTEIRDGRIIYGEKLPSTRALSRHLEVSRSTIELAYEQLVSEGYIETVPCRGYFVAQIDELYHLKKVDTKVPKKKRTVKNYRYDFTPNGVDLKSFPYNAWRKLSKDILVEDKTELFRSGDPQGEYSFRNAICNYLYQARGVNCGAHQIIVGAGSDYLLMLLHMIVGEQHRIAFEDPAYKQAYRMAESLGYQTVPIPLDKNGMKIGELEDSQADIAYVTPSHQYPTGIVMPMKRRMELLNWANRKEHRYIVEDDYDSEFRYKGKPIPALQGYDTQDKVIYLGTFSKSIAPAIRMSYMVLPEPLLTEYEKRCGFVSTTVSKVDQMIVQRFIEEGYYERHLNKTRALYKNRHDTLIDGLRSLKEICEISGEHAGVHLLLTFRDGRSEKTLIRLAEERDIRVYGLSECRIQEYTDESSSTILLGYANLTEEQIKEAVRLLCDCWK